MYSKFNLEALKTSSISSIRRSLKNRALTDTRNQLHSAGAVNLLHIKIEGSRALFAINTLESFEELERNPEIYSVQNLVGSLF